MVWIWGGDTESQELDSMILMGPIQLMEFCDSTASTSRLTTFPAPAFKVTKEQKH